ncbi:MAG TPA: bifunctional phosphoribosyl-AMP cyclohydrolase/phosphoribosyl-ATP diphosphatase HisIE [Steroidobacteraceae bacterium]|nr:bifunctional phosphoribosyl-AMP cyclohydrolase/phosphoribosyl-ATP diphosphatase HisIE [Steroidobacteraceae bacterium]
MRVDDIPKLAWDGADGLLPAIIQHARTGTVLMLGYMNREALRETLKQGRVVFYSRSRQKLWLKGETSGHFLDVVSVTTDCDSDTLLILAEPHGPVCHRGTATCFPDRPAAAAEELAFLAQLESVIAQRIADKPSGSYTARLFAEGRSRIAQKVAEEGVEVALAAVVEDDGKLVAEAADLLYHLLLLVKSRGLSLARVVHELESRHANRA